MQHLDEGLIQELIDGEIPSSELRPITDHLATCNGCRERLAQAQATMITADEILELLDAPAPLRAQTLAASARAKSPAWPRQLAWAASVMVAVGIGYAARGGTVVAPVQPTTPVSAIALDTASPPSVATEAAAAEPDRRRAPPPTEVATANTAKSSADAVEEPRAERNQVTVGGVRAVPPPLTAAPAPAAAARRLEGVGEALESKAVGRFVARDAAGASTQASPAARVDTVTLRDAMQLLGGRLRLVDGLVPTRVESDGIAVRVIYDLAAGSLILSQRIVEGRVAWQLIGPPGLPVDSLNRLRRAVHE